MPDERTPRRPPARPAVAPRRGSSPARREMQKTIMLMIVAIMVLDAVAIVLYQRYGMQLRDARARFIVSGIWMVATVALLAPFLKRIRRLRAEGRAAAGR